MQGNVPGALIPIVLFICGAVIAIGTPIARAIARRIERKPLNDTSPEVLARLERMEHAIESIAVEIERVSEGQRFTTKLLSEQKSGRLAAADDESRR